MSDQAGARPFTLRAVATTFLVLSVVLFSVLSFARTVSVESDRERTLANFKGFAPPDANRLPGFSGIVSRREYIFATMKRLQSRWDELSNTEVVFQYIKTLVPFYSWMNVHNAARDAPFSFGFLPGDNLSAQGNYLLRLPEAHFRTAIDQTTNQIADASHLDAFWFLNSFFGYSTSDKQRDNLAGIVELSALLMLIVMIIERTIRARKWGLLKTTEWNADPIQQKLARTLAISAQAELSGDAAVAARTMVDAVTILNSNGWSRSEAGNRLVHAVSLVKIQAPKKVYQQAKSLGERLYDCLR